MCIPVLAAFLALAASGCYQASGEGKNAYKAIPESAVDSGFMRSGLPENLKGLKPADAPGITVIDGLSSLYGPVRFDCKAHAEMAMIGGGCAVCHHHETGKKVNRCSACHGSPLSEGGISKPGLKAAYHGQCLDCHRETGSGIGCSFCHAPKGGIEPATEKRDSALPKTVEYATKYEKGPRVSFDHESHKAGRSCGECHRAETCASCHRPGGSRPKAAAKAGDPHDKCYACHGKGKELEFACDDCHAK